MTLSNSSNVWIFIDVHNSVKECMGILSRGVDI